MLESVGYFDENNIVEDIATSVNMAINGWTGVYGPSEKKPIMLTAESAGNEVGFVVERDKFDKHIATLAIQNQAVNI